MITRGSLPGRAYRRRGHANVMDEYRPFPSNQPPPDDVIEDVPEPEMALGADEGIGNTGRPERPAPNLDHPGGHLHGAVARLNKPRRFGFLRADYGVEFFYHASASESGPTAFDAHRPGQELECECHQDEHGRGLAATVVNVIGEPPPEQPRPPRPPRAERGERPAGRERRASGSQAAERWHVAVLRERSDMPVASQLERLLNERAVKPGNFTLGFVEHEEGTDCWVAYYSAVDGGS